MTPTAVHTLPLRAFPLLAAAAALLCVGAALGAPGWLAAQPAASGEPPEAERVAFRHLTTAEGLSNESVSAVVQDRFGFIWIGTADGLNRFDGYEVVEYTRGPDSTTLSGNVVSALAEDASGALWAGSTARPSASSASAPARAPSPTTT